MADFIIYHNPRCSKSRQTLALLEEKGIKPKVVEYLKDTPSVQELQGIIEKLGIEAKALLRTKEDEYKVMDLANETEQANVLAAMHQHPKLIERPIVVHQSKAVIGRPPENVLALL